MPRNSFSGIWKLSIGRSTLPFTLPGAVVLEVAEDGDDLTLTETMRLEGREEVTTIRARFDDRVYPVVNSSMADGFAVRRIDEFTWRTRGTKAGAFSFSATVALIEGGATIREDAETTLADGSRAPAVVIYERIAGEAE